MSGREKDCVWLCFDKAKIVEKAGQHARDVAKKCGD